MYKIGDLIGYSTMDGLFLCEITDIVKLKDKDLGELYLTTKVLYNEDLQKPISNRPKYIILPHQEYEIRTFEEYIESVQNEIDKRQNILNKIKENKNEIK